MFKLSKNWITEGISDAEYRQYLLMAYLRDIHHVFKNKILYPPLSELIEHYRHLIQIKNNLQNIKYAHKELKGIDWQNMKLLYDNPPGNPEYQSSEIDVIEKVIDFGIPKMEKEIEYGKQIFDEIETHLQYATVGLTPLNKSIGYLFIQNYPAPELLIYKYEISSLYAEIEPEHTPDQKNTAFKSLKTEYLATYTMSISKSLTSIKQEIIKQHPDIPNPAVYGFFPSVTASMEYTILPIVKRIMLKIAG
ncbi:MAG: hypothetical protein KatS3mg028_0536 [Bacteroidia bacterium]|nr:MAG: hypothetical protein KatS3mg028_0536 [Bacteroidia bacterium]